MALDTINIIKEYYEKGYKKKGAGFQRRYPNEELCRFMGRNFFSIPKNKRKKIKILEVGCGSGGNLWMLANEGFRTYGLDISSKSIQITKQILRKINLKANLKVGSMTNLPYKNNYFDCIIDVFSSSCLNAKDGNKFLIEISRTLKKGGVFFSYFPSKKSKMYRSKKKILYDKDTILKLKEKKNIFTINNLPFRFLNKRQYVGLLDQNNLDTYYAEELTRTYFKGKDQFSYIIIQAKKKI